MKRRLKQVKMVAPRAKMEVHINEMKPRVEIKEEEIKAGKEKAAGMLKAVEAYLLAKQEIYA